MFARVGNWGDGEIWRITSGSFPSNAYICEAPIKGGAFLIDGGLDPLEIDRSFGALGLFPSMVICTHGHFDHIGSAQYFQSKYNASVYLHESDVGVMQKSNFLLMAFGFKERIKYASVQLVSDQSTVNVGGATLRYHHLPGHTPGSSIIEIGSAYFTGDTLYADGVGLSDLPGENPDQLKASINKFWKCLRKEMTIFPGHGKEISCDELKLNNLKLLEFLKN